MKWYNMRRTKYDDDPEKDDDEYTEDVENEYSELNDDEN